MKFPCRSFEWQQTGRSLQAIFAVLVLFMVAGHRFTSIGLSSSTSCACLFLSPPMYVAEELGEAFDIAVNISNVENLHSCKLTIAYNESLLDVTQVVEGDFFPQQAVFQFWENESHGFVTINMSLLESDPPLAGNGTIANIAFEAIEAPAACTVDILKLVETQLYGPSLELIDHETVSAIYFWRSMQPDPTGEALLDLYTQKGGEGSNEPGGYFLPGELVNLTSYVTYRGWPVQGKLVAFQVLDSLNVPALILIAQTDENGFARVVFGVPEASETIEISGLWTAFSTVQVAEWVVWDTISFWVVTAHGPTAAFEWIPEYPYVNSTVRFDASSSLPGWNGTHEMSIAEYRWDFGDGTKTNTSDPIVNHKFRRAGVYTVKLTVYAPGATPDTNSTTHEVTVISIPVGGYSLAIREHTTEKSFTSYLTMAAILTVGLAVFCVKKRIN